MTILDRNHFANLIEGVAINSDMAMHFKNKQQHADDDEQEQRCRQKAEMYFNRRNERIEQLHSWFDEVEKQMNNANDVKTAERNSLRMTISLELWTDGTSDDATKRTIEEGISSGDFGPLHQLRERFIWSRVVFNPQAETTS